MDLANFRRATHHHPPLFTLRGAVFGRYAQEPLPNVRHAILTGDGLPAATFPPAGSTADAYVTGRSLQYAEFATGDHGIWHFVYNHPQVHDWLFAQSLPEPAGIGALSAACVAALLKRPRRSRA